MRRSLIYYWRSHLAVGLGAAVATAVLTGALLIGDSLRGSLADLAERRLGRITHAVTSTGFFRQALADDLRATDGVSDSAPIIALRGSAVHVGSGARISKLQVLAVEDRFTGLYPASVDTAALDFSRREGQIQPSVVLNRTVASELGAAIGDNILLTFERPAQVPRETVVGREEAASTFATLRLAVSGMVTDREVGGFALIPHQATPRNVFVELSRVQRVLFDRAARERINVVLVAGASVADLSAAVQRTARAEDFGLLLTAADERLVVESQQFVLPAAQARAVESVAAASGAEVQPVLTYLANSIEVGGGSVPYSTVAALDPAATTALGRLERTDGWPVAVLADDEILLDEWAAADLRAQDGDEVLISYYVLGPRDELAVERSRFRLGGVVRLTGLAVDSSLTPDYPGMTDADDISGWSPPFPVDLSLIGERDEAYWDLYRAAPKAFVSAATGGRLWSSRFGDRTSLRLAPPPGVSVEALAATVAAGLPGALGDGGLSVHPIHETALRQARGATDFAGLFFGLSLFLIAAATLLVGLLFRLAVEQRVREVGLLRAVGFPEAKARNRFLKEGLCIALLGAAVGVVGGVGYAWLMLAGLRSWWLPAIGAPVLFLHVEPSSLTIGGVASLVVVVVTIWLALRRLRRVPTPALLAGSAAARQDDAPRRRGGGIAVGALVVAAALVVVALVADAADNPAISFGIGASLLVAGVAAFRRHCAGVDGTERLAAGPLALVAMSARNSRRHRLRSVLSVSLIAFAVFSIVVVAANRSTETVDVADPRSGAGGFQLVAESEIPILEDIAMPAGRAELGVTPEGEELLQQATFIPFKLLPGDDASCLNLFRPEKPRVLGVPQEMIERGGFTFQQTIEREDNPWRLLERDLGPGVVPAIADYGSAKWILHSGLGKDLVMADEEGREVRFRFVALLRKSVFQSEILISEARFERLFPRRTGASFFLVETPENLAAAARTALEEGLAPFGLDVASTADRLAAFQEIENTYISTFEALGGLGLVLGTVGLGVVLLRNVLERRAELATMRAFGFRRRRLALMVLIENAYLLLVGVGIGTGAGLAAAVPHLMTSGGGLPWPSLSLTLVAVLVVGMLSSLVAARRVLEAPLLPGLRAE